MNTPQILNMKAKNFWKISYTHFFVILALIQFVKLEMVEDRVTCLSQNIYPAPEITWVTEPPSAIGSFQNFTRKTSDTKGLFTVESTISITGNISDHTYVCSVVSADGAQLWTASLKHQGNEKTFYFCVLLGL